MTFPTENGEGAGLRLPVVELVGGEWLCAPSEEDVASAEPKNPRHCVYCKNIQRTTGYPNTLVTATVAYAEVLHGKQRVALKMSVPPAARSTLEEYDRTGKWTGSPIYFSAIKPSQRITQKQKDNKRNGKRRTNGELKYGRPKTAERRNLTTRHLSGHIITEREENFQGTQS